MRNSLRRAGAACGAARDGHDGGPSGGGGAGWAGPARWELWGAGGLWALLEGKTESTLKVVTFRYILLLRTAWTCLAV
jgi:hypothetical protein